MLHRLRSLSLAARLLTAASLILAIFVLVTGWLLDRAFRDSALVAVQQRLQAQVYILLGAADLDPEQQTLTLPQALPEARFSIPGSGLYALVVDAAGRPVWRSPSLLGMRLDRLPPPATPGLARFSEITTADDQPLFVLGFSVSWELANERYRRYTFWVAETRAGFDAQVNRFRRGLWGWLLAAAAALLVVQLAVLRWTLQPLRRIARQVREIETGERLALSGRYPAELQPLADNLNDLINQGRASLERYRNAVGDLAHSLKTPLAVLRSSLANPPTRDELLATIKDQVGRMNATVEYQLQRAAAGGRVGLRAPLAVDPVAQKIADSLAKVYHAKRLDIGLAVSADSRFFGDQGDLLEILGNLADNACKWARGVVRIGATQDAAGLTLSVADDGPGIPPPARAEILDRGRRADPDTPGHGIGLAVVRDIVEDVYGGELVIADGPLGGAEVKVRIPLPRRTAQTLD